MLVSTAKAPNATAFRNRPNILICYRPRCGAGLSHVMDQLEQVSVIPACVADFAAHGRFLVRVGSRNVESEPFQDGKVCRSMVLAVAGLVFVEDNVKHPVQTVFDRPMRS